MINCCQITVKNFVFLLNFSIFSSGHFLKKLQKLNKSPNGKQKIEQKFGSNVKFLLYKEKLTRTIDNDIIFEPGLKIVH